MNITHTFKTTVYLHLKLKLQTHVIIAHARRTDECWKTYPHILQYSVCCLCFTLDKSTRNHVAKKFLARPIIRMIHRFEPHLSCFVFHIKVLQAMNMSFPLICKVKYFIAQILNLLKIVNTTIILKYYMRSVMWFSTLMTSGNDGVKRDWNDVKIFARIINACQVRDALCTGKILF